MQRYSVLKLWCVSDNVFLSLSCENNIENLVTVSTPDDNLNLMVQHLIEVSRCDSDQWRPGARFLERTSNTMFNFLVL